MALNLSSLGASVESVGWFGCDDRGDELVQILTAAGISVDSAFRFFNCTDHKQDQSDCIQPANM